MFTKQFVAIIGVLGLLVCALPVEAKTNTQTSAAPAKPKGDRYKYGYGVSETTGWRKIDGWQQSVVDRDPNLQHWSWLGMQEMNKGYKRLRPGQVDRSRPSFYKKPVHVPVTMHPVQKVVTYQPTESRYVRPVRESLPSRSSVNTNVRLSAPATNVSLAAPRTSVRLAAPSTNIRWGVPNTGVKLAVPSTNAQLASRDTHAKLSSQPRRPVIAQDEMSECSGPISDDNFESPESDDGLKYGPRTHHNYGHSSASANVRGKLVRKRQ